MSPENNRKKIQPEAFVKVQELHEGEFASVSDRSGLEAAQPPGVVYQLLLLTVVGGKVAAAAAAWTQGRAGINAK